MIDDDLDAREAELRLLQWRVRMEFGTIKLARASRRAARAFGLLGMRFQLVEIEAADLGDFDNRAHDWIRGA